MDWQGFLDSRPVIAEMIATVDMIEIAKATGCRTAYLSCKQSLTWPRR